MAAAFGLAVLLFAPADGILEHFVLTAGVLVIGLCLFTTRAVGGGVVKFFTACSLWIGPNSAFVIFMVICNLGGGLLCLGIRLLRGRLEAVPYLPPMLVALALSVPQAPMWHAIMDGLHRSI